jgi:hypothetical protein
MCTSNCLQSLSCATTSHPISLRCISISLSYLCLSSEWYPAFTLYNRNFVSICNLPHACYSPCQSHLHCIDHSSNIWRRIQIIKFLIMQLSLATCHPFILSFKYSHQQPVLKCPKFLKCLWLPPHSCSTVV